jgi:hypothetical protein
MALQVAKEALELCYKRADHHNDGISREAADNALTTISDAQRANADNAGSPATYMTADQGRDWAWKQVRRDVGDSAWTAGESGTFFGFFLYGWNYRGQYELQRRAAEVS